MKTSFFILALVIVSPALADEQFTAAVSPFDLLANETEEGFTGFAIDIWNEIAAINGYPTQFETSNITSIFAEVSEGRANVGIGALTINAQREEKWTSPITFTIPDSGLCWDQMERQT